MRKINNRQYKLTQIRPKSVVVKARTRGKRGNRYNSRLDRRGRK